MKIRLDNAKKLLISTDLPIYKIDVESGFENEFYFSRIFKRKGNITPSGYRNKNKI
ncbi:MAG: helix-turn-helix domain-containing protein [Clostridia bacterium]|nr:helix-turn-helix domain-containing protein [Clostridia bacterium]